MSIHIHTGTPPLIAGAVARIERRLPHPGRILVRVGQRVEPGDVVARCLVPGTPQIVNISRELMIAPAQLSRAMILEVGNKVTKGDALARMNRLGGYSYAAPVSGEIVGIDTETGYVTIMPDAESYELLANARGIVMEEIPHEGVLIETPAAQIYGAFGFGKERSGVLHLLVTDPSEPILPERIDARSAYSIIIGGSSITAAALRRAAQHNVCGIIVGGIDEAELRAFLGWEQTTMWGSGIRHWHSRSMAAGYDYGLTLVITEGFGVHSMSTPLFELLARHDRQEAFIEGTTRLRQQRQRPRVVIPLSSRTPGLQLDAPRLHMRPGAVVRRLDAQHIGETAKVRSVFGPLHRMSLKNKFPLVEIQTELEQSLILPQTAVEILS